MTKSKTSGIEIPDLIMADDGTVGTMSPIESPLSLAKKTVTAEMIKEHLALLKSGKTPQEVIAALEKKITKTKKEKEKRKPKGPDKTKIDTIPEVPDLDYEDSGNIPNKIGGKSFKRFPQQPSHYTAFSSARDEERMRRRSETFRHQDAPKPSHFQAFEEARHRNNTKHKGEREIVRSKSDYRPPVQYTPPLGHYIDQDGRKVVKSISVNSRQGSRSVGSYDDRSQGDRSHGESYYSDAGDRRSDHGRRHGARHSDHSRRSHELSEEVEDYFDERPSRTRHDGNMHEGSLSRRRQQDEISPRRSQHQDGRQRRDASPKRHPREEEYRRSDRRPSHYDHDRHEDDSSPRRSPQEEHYRREDQGRDSGDRMERAREYDERKPNRRLPQPAYSPERGDVQRNHSERLRESKPYQSSRGSRSSDYNSEVRRSSHSPHRDGQGHPENLMRRRSYDDVPLRPARNHRFDDEDEPLLPPPPPPSQHRLPPPPPPDEDDGFGVPVIANMPMPRRNSFEACADDTSFVQNHDFENGSFKSMNTMNTKQSRRLRESDIQATIQEEDDDGFGPLRKNERYTKPGRRQGHHDGWD